MWATRRIGEIIDELDLQGQNKELVNELVALSLKHGIMTPYTSFLADENLSLRDRDRLLTEARTRSEQGLSVATGSGGFLQRSYKSQLKRASRAGSKGIQDAAEEADGALSGGSALNGRGRDSKYGYSISGRGGRAPAAPGDGLGGGGLGGARGLGQNDAFGDSGGKDESKRRVAQRVRRIGTRTFYWKNDEWQDAEYGTLKADAQKKIIEVEQFSDEYFKLSQLDNGRYSKYLTVTEPLLVRIDGRNYRIVPPQKKP